MDCEDKPNLPKMKTPRTSLSVMSKHPALGFLPSAVLLALFLFLFPRVATVLILVLPILLALVVLKKKVQKFLENYDGE